MLNIGVYYRPLKHMVLIGKISAKLGTLNFYYNGIIRNVTLTFEAFLPRLPTTTLTWDLLCFKVVTAGHGTRSPSGENAVWNGIFTLPGIMPRLNLNSG